MLLLASMVARTATQTPRLRLRGFVLKINALMYKKFLTLIAELEKFMYSNNWTPQKKQRLVTALEMLLNDYNQKGGDRL